MHDIFNLAVSAAVATGIVLALRWQHNEEARLAAEAAKTEAELKNLRSQINPHFLLNTLNNIYALTAIDQTRAQEAIQQLSRLLRHMLYENQEAQVDLQDEIQFLENYVSLMKIRLSQDVDVKLTKQVSDAHLKVAPLLFISLVENAFKHGISPTNPSFVHISILEDGHILRVTIENSYYPKNEQDRSGHGIGLNQVQQRLDLAYSGRYDWQKGISEDGNTYTSQITIII
jgi:sensor histidine kinase YesM